MSVLAYDLGPRWEEIAGLHRHRVHLNLGLVHVVDVLQRDKSIREYPKGKKNRMLPLTRRATAVLES